MPASFQQILNSRLFKFIVGEKVDGSPTEFLVHEEAISQLSKSLHSLIKGGLKESQTGCAIWDEVSKETFEQLAQFAYTGDYSLPKMEKRTRARKEKDEEWPPAIAETDDMPSPKDWPPATVEIVEEETIPVEIPEPAPDPPPAAEPAEYDWAVWGKKLERKGDKRKRKGTHSRLPNPAHIFSNLQSLSYPLLTSRDNYADTCEPSGYFNRDQSYSNVFLSHASLYVLGDFRMIDSLKALALYKLHKTLCVFELDDENAEDVIDLVRYAYSEEGGGGLSDVKGFGPLRSLVCQYLAENSWALSFDEGFMELLGEGGQFVKDFFKFEVQRNRP